MLIGNSYICVTRVQRAALSPERDNVAKLGAVDNDTFDPSYTQDFSYNCYAEHTLGLLKCLSVAKCEVILGLGHCYIVVATATATIPETKQTLPKS